MRDNINVNSSLKLFESYRDFAGGLNTQQSNEMLKDNQVTIAENVDLALTHSIKKRTGRTQITGATGWSDSAVVQGLFKFVNNAETVLISAVDGKLWYARPTSTSYGNWTQIPIDSGSFTFQTTDSVEAVQYRDWLYVATGTKLVRCKVYLSSGSPVATAESVADQYKPTSQEALYFGLNILNTTPSAYLVDLTTATTLSIEALGIYCSNIRPAINTTISFTAYRKTNNNAPTDTDTEYEWYYKKSSDTTWTTAVAYSTANANKTYSLSFDTPGLYDVKVSMRLANHHTINDTYLVTSLEVFATTQAAALPATNIQKCRKILLHWDRIILYDPKPSTTDGTTNQQDQIFISQLEEPTFFPAYNVFSFSADTQQPVRKIVRYRNILLIFTPDTIQSMSGKSPSDYVRSLINNQLGAIWGNSVQVVENDIFFVSKQGIYAVRPNVYTQDNFNVADLDTIIKDQFAEDFVVSDAIAGSGQATNQVVSVVHDNQYFIYSTNNKIYRYYFSRKAWVMDTLDHLGDVRFSMPIIASFNGEQTLIEPIYRADLGTFPSSSLYPSASLYPNASAAFLALDKSVYTDVSLPYTMTLRTKYFDLSQAFNYKKLRRLYVIARMQSYALHLGIKVEADTSIILDPETGHTETNSITGAVTWVTTFDPNFDFYSGTYPFPITGWVLGEAPLGDLQLSVVRSTIRAKCRRVRLTFYHEEATPCEIYGFGLEFRSKRP